MIAPRKRNVGSRKPPKCQSASAGWFLPNRRRWVLAIAAAWILGGSLSPAARADDFIDALKQPVLKPGEATDQHIRYVTSRIPKLRLPASAADWQKESHSLRETIRRDVVFRGVPEEWHAAKPKVEWKDEIATGKGYRLRKLRYEALPGLWIPAVLYMPENLKGKAPVFLNVNGHDRNGKAAEYKQLRCINLAKRGIIALNPEWLGMGQLGSAGYRHNDLAKLDLTGRSGLSVFFLAMSRGLDVLLDLPQADPKRVGVTGLSGGGWQTIILSSLDARVTLSVPVAGYSSLHQRVLHRSSIGDLEQNPCDLIRHGDYAHLTALMVPRPTLLIYNSKDNCCFVSSTVKPNTFDPVVPFFEQARAADRFEYYENSDPGTHNYELDNRERLYRFVRRHFFPGSEGKNYPEKEISSKAEVKTAAELNVDLPANNATFGSLAADAASHLPVASGSDSGKNPASRRQVLREILRWRELAGRLEKVGERIETGNAPRGQVQPPAKKNAKPAIPVSPRTVERLRLVLGSKKATPPQASGKPSHDWVVPVVIVTGPVVRRTVLLVADEGRAPQAARIAELVDSGSRVVIIEPVLMGEARPAGIPYMNAHLIATIGDRPLGVQAAQIAAAARALAPYGKTGPVELLAVGPRASLAVLCAAAVMGGDSIASLKLEGLPQSLKDLLRPEATFDSNPEAYCFGLLREFDIPQLRRLATPKEKPSR